MAFRVIGKRSSGRRTSGVSISSAEIKNVTYAFIRFAPHILKDLGWRRGDRIEVARGYGKDRGWIRLRLVDPAHYVIGYALGGGKNDSTLRLLVRGLSDGEKHSMRSCETKVYRHSIFAKLPDWCPLDWADDETE